MPKNRTAEYIAEGLRRARIRKDKRKAIRRQRRVMYWRMNCTTCCPCCGCDCDFTFGRR